MNGVPPKDRYVSNLFFIDALSMHSWLSSNQSIPGPSEMARPSSSHQTERRTPKLLSTEGSIIPGETEKDGLLRREYVLVGDTRAVELNRTTDGDLPS
jgi:hypothetical protein